MNLITEMSTNPTFIFIDASYFCFYRYHSLLTWWKNAYPEQADVLLDPYQNQEFVDKFRKTFVENVAKIPNSRRLKTYPISKSELLYFKDSKLILISIK